MNSAGDEHNKAARGPYQRPTLVHIDADAAEGGKNYAVSEVGMGQGQGQGPS